MKEFLMITVMILLVSCNHYYKAKLIQPPTTVEMAIIIDSLNKDKKYFILRNGNSGYFMRNPQVSGDRKMITSTLQMAGVDHRLHFMQGRDGKYKYKNNRPNDRHVLDEVHFYLPADVRMRIGPSNLPVNSIEKIEIIEKDKSRTAGSAILGFMVGLLGTAGIATLLYLNICFFC